jgi:chemotaxis protein MotA
MARLGKRSPAPGDATPELRLEPRLTDFGLGAAEARPTAAQTTAASPAAGEPVDRFADDDDTAEDFIQPLERGERDLASWGGIGIGFLLILSATLLGGALPAYADLPAFLMVFGGTTAVTQISFSLEDSRRLPEALKTAFLMKLGNPAEAALRLVALADKARLSGFFALEAYLPRLADDPFLVKAIALVVDNTPAEVIERELKTELQALLARHSRAAAMLRRAGEVAPAMGLIGTLIGLVQMLLNLNNPGSIGPAMAVAILATLYGAVLANMVLLPLAHKLERNSHAEALLHNLSIMAAVSIALQESPRRTEVLLNSVLPPAERVSYFD